MEQVCEDTHTGFKFNFSKLDSVFAWLGLIVFLADIVLDFVTLVFFYQTGAYWRFSILLILILGSSVLVNTYSWLWYKYDKFEREMAVETCLSPRLFHVVHVFQLGFFVRSEQTLLQFCSYSASQTVHISSLSHPWL